MRLRRTMILAYTVSSSVYLTRVSRSLDEREWEHSSPQADSHAPMSPIAAHPSMPPGRRLER